MRRYMIHFVFTDNTFAPYGVVEATCERLAIADVRKRLIELKAWRGMGIARLKATLQPS